MQRKILYSFSLGLPKFDHQPAAFNGIPFEKVISDRKQYCAPFYFHYYKDPLYIVEGKMQYLYDHQGKRYQDWISGISTVSVGHSHPEVTKAIIDQSKKLVLVSQLNLTDVQAQYAKMLCDKLGDGFNTVYLTNSGGEANDFAVHLAKMYTKTHKFLSVRNGYHGLIGNSSSTTNMPTWSANALRGRQFEKLSWPSKYRGLHQSADALIRQAEQIINSNCGGRISGMLLECIQGIGGINTFVDGYLPRIYDTVKKYGGLMICDEVQTGFGRIGNKYWGFKEEGVKPDIVTLAKGIANGLPLGAVVTRREIAEAVDHNVYNTTGGGNVQVRVAMQVIKAVDNEKLAENSDNVGNYLLKELSKTQQKCQFIGDVRGKGLMIGIEIVKDKKTKEPSKDLCNDFMEKCRERGMLLGRGGAGGNVLRLQPPLCMSMEDAKYFIGAFNEISDSYK